MSKISTSGKKRGRPPKLEKTIQGILIRQWASEMAKYPNYQPGMDEATKNILNQDSFNEILKDFGATTPRKLIIDLYSIDDSTPKHVVDAILSKLRRCEQKEILGKIRGTIATKENSGERAIKVWSKNQDLIRQIKNKQIFKTDAARKILKDWLKRGHGKKPSSIRSITGWYHQYIQIVGKRLVKL